MFSILFNNRHRNDSLGNCRNFPHASKNISILPLAGQKKVKEKTASGIPPDKGFLSAENNSMNSTWWGEIDYDCAYRSWHFQLSGYTLDWWRIKGIKASTTWTYIIRWIACISGETFSNQYAWAVSYNQQRRCLMSK